MKISELSTRSGVPVASIKFYLREELLAPGAKTSETQSSYDDGHLARLRLIRAFLDVGGLSVASARAVLSAIDDEDMPFGVAAGIAATALPTSPALDPGTDAGIESRGRSDLAALIADRGWTVDPGNAGYALAARIIDDYAALGRDDLLGGLGDYADAAELVARSDMQLVAEAASRSASTETVVIGTVLGDALFAGLRRMAHESVSRTFFPVSDEVAAQYGHGDAVIAAPFPPALESVPEPAPSKES